MAVNEGALRIFSATVASSTTSTAEIDMGAYFTRVALEIPAGVNNQTRILVSSSKGGTYRALYTGFPDNDATPALFSLASAVSDCMIAIPASGRFLKVETSVAVAADRAYKIVGIS